ncbi:MAG: lysophospholipid acyltransferase family protein [Gemmataceae bacterium]
MAQKKKKRSASFDYTIYLVVRFVVCILQMLTWSQARAFAHVLAWIAYKVDKRHRLVAIENLEHAFPGQYTLTERDQMVRNVYRHFCTLLTEIVLIPRKFHVTNRQQHVTPVNPERLVQGILSDRPLLLITCHFGNWELAGYFLGLCGITIYSIARTLDNPYLDQFLRKFRQNTGQVMLAKKGDYDKINEVLASGSALATLGDQNAGRKGAFVDFFGRPASTHKAVALMAIEYNVPMMVSGTMKVGEPCRYQIICDDWIDPEEYKNHPNPVEAITQRFTAAIERLAKQAPEQYFWLHNRWKEKPPQTRKRAA